MSSPTILEAGVARVELRPDAGGRVAQIEIDGPGGERQRLLRGQGDSGGAWYEWGSYPLVPWSNRIAAGEFRFDGRTHHVPVNFVDGTALHGLAAEVPWAVVTADDCSATLQVDIDTAPFTLTAIQRFELTSDRLHQTLGVVNRARHRVPVGLGIHPWFRAGPVAIPATAAWPLADALPTGSPEPLPPELDLRTLGEPPPLDHCLTGLVDRRASVPGLTLEWSPDITHLVVYTAVPGWQCVEPVSNANDGFNLMAAGVAGHGVRVLEAGATWEAAFAFDWSAP